MNDYKELVKNLNKNIYGQCSEYCKDIAVLYKEAADAIEQLVKERNELKEVNILLTANCEHFKRERDAAIADLKNAARFPCRYCAKDNDKCDCYTAYDKWEWRGVQE